MSNTQLTDSALTQWAQSMNSNLSSEDLAWLSNVNWANLQYPATSNQNALKLNDESHHFFWQCTAPEPDASHQTIWQPTSSKAIAPAHVECHTLNRWDWQLDAGQRRKLSKKLFDLRARPFGEIHAMAPDTVAIIHPKLIEHWVDQVEKTAIGFVDQNQLYGYAIVRAGSEHMMIGPVVAYEKDIAQMLITAVLRVGGAQKAEIWCEQNHPHATETLTALGFEQSGTEQRKRYCMGQANDINHDVLAYCML